MAKKQYKIEIDEVTTDILTALQNANINYKLYEVNEVNKGSDVFAHTSNFAFTEIILNPVTEMDTTEYTDQELKNHTGKLLRNMPYEMTKEVRL